MLRPSLLIEHKAEGDSEGWGARPGETWRAREVSGAAPSSSGSCGQECGMAQPEPPWRAEASFEETQRPCGLTFHFMNKETDPGKN